jgi:hypothetical protein
LAKKIQVEPKRDIGFAKRENFSQKDIYVLPREKKDRFCPKKKVYPRIKKGSTKEKKA